MKAPTPPAARSLAADVDELVTLGYVARLAKWHRKRMWRRLKKLDADAGGGLLQNVSAGPKPRFLVGLRALKLAWPGLFTDKLEELSDRVEKLEDRLDGLTQADEVLAREIGTTRNEVRYLTKKCSQLRLIA
jgi:hypothetical protein